VSAGPARIGKLDAGDRIPAEVLDQPVVGVNLVPGTLRDQLGDGPTLLVFLRQLGCVFCRETVTDLRRHAESDLSYPVPLLFIQGSPTEGRVFLSRFWPAARAVADRGKHFYAAFGVERGSLLQTLGPAVWRAHRRAAAKGIAQGERVGDVWMMPAVLRTEGDRITWRHRFRHAGDLPDFAQLPTAAATTTRT